jgi:DNA-binding CsgD family transcriptional regulator
MKNSVRGMDGADRSARIPEGLATFAAFEAALGVIPQPTFVIDGGGQILHANALGEELLGRERVNIQRSLAQAAQDQSQQSAWQLTSLGGLPRSSRFIAVFGPTEARSNRAAGSQASVRKWNLTARQAEVLDLVGVGATNATIAETLGIKERTVEFHLSAIFDKAGVDNRATLIARLSVP